jgi:hypothetical protein
MPAPNPLASLVPAAFGMLVMQNSGGVGKAFSYSTSGIPAIASVSQTLTNDSFSYASQMITATPTTPQVGSFTFSDSLTPPNTLTRPVTIFGVTFPSYAGTGISSPSEPALTADEQFTATGQNEQVTVNGAGGSISVSSSAPTVVSVSTTGASTFTATAGNAGFATITITDGSNGASTSYKASVTTTTIPIASRARAH